VVRIDRYSTVFSYLNHGVNIRDAETNGDVRGAAAAHLGIRKPVGADGDLVRIIADAMQDKGTVLTRGRFLRSGCLQNDGSSHDRSSGGIEHRAAESIGSGGAAWLRAQVSANAQRCAEDHSSPSIHKSASTPMSYRLRIAAGGRKKQCRLSLESGDKCHCDWETRREAFSVPVQGRMQT
jgi:hypothetical protein